MNWASILYIIGLELSAFGVAMMVPALLSLQFADPDWVAFMASALVTVFLGGNLILMNRNREQSLSHRDGFMLTVLTWTVMALFGAIPLWLSSVAPTFLDAYFESLSGLTGTGATVLTGLDYMGHGVLFWRCLLQWLGGMGIIVLAVAVLPFLRVGGLQVYKSEMPGVVKDKLQPRLQETAKMLWGVYVVLTILCTIAYYLGGMGAFDAICHALTTVATGGFANYDASFGYFNNGILEWIAIVFMLLGGMNFALHYVFFTQNKLSVYTKNEEVRLYFGLIAGASIIITTVLMVSHEYGLLEAVRKAAFNVVSIATTTGYASADYSQWYVIAPMLILIIGFIGGCSGSTSGGLKQLRILMVVKQGGREMYNLLHPHGIRHVKVGGRTVPDSVMQAVWSFGGIYVLCYLLLSLMLAAHGIDLVTAFTAIAATITCVGPGLGEVGPAGNFAHLPATAKMICCFAMLLGRLEIFTLLIIFNPQFWRR